MSSSKGSSFPLTFSGHFVRLLWDSNNSCVVKQLCVVSFFLYGRFYQLVSGQCSDIYYPLRRAMYVKDSRWPLPFSMFRISLSVLSVL